MILNSEIYERAVNLIDDPNISRLYVNDTIAFQKLMYKFLLNGVSIITAPTSVSTLLSSQVSPEGKLEEFDGEGEEGIKTFKLSTTPLPQSEIKAYVNKTRVQEYIYDATNNSVTFAQPVKQGETCAIEWYYAGGFNGDFSTINGNMPLNSLIERVKDLLTRVTVISWADKIKQFLLDARNVLTDTDFKVHAPANLLDAKNRWYKQLEEQVFNLQNKLDWDLRNRNRSYYGY